MAKQTFTTGQVLTAAQMTDLQQTAMTGGAASTKTVSYVLVAADAGTRVAMNAAGSTTITVNTGLFSAGDTVSIQNIGAGVCTVTAGTATVNTSGSLVLAQYQGGILYFTSASAAIFFQFATPASGDIEGVTAGVGISGGGTSGTVTITNSMATAIDAKGDLVAGTGADTFSRLAVGSNGTVLTADSAEATGLKWTTVAGGTSGLTLISQTTIGSGVSSVTVSNAFSATYDNYLIVIAFDTASSNSSTNLELGSGGNVYIGNAVYMQGSSSTVNGVNYNTSTTMFVGYNATDGGGSIIQVINPNKAKKTLVTAAGGGFFTTSANNLIGAVYYANETTQYTSFKISPSTGTYTGGSIRTYGYQNS